MQFRARLFALGIFIVVASTMARAQMPSTRIVAVAKVFGIPSDQIKQLATNRGGAIASDRIVVDGQPVGYMYRETPRNSHDSGWAFLAGDEDDSYMADSSKHGIYDVNTISNYDPDIIPLLDAPVGSAFIRENGRLVRDPIGAPNEH